VGPTTKASGEERSEGFGETEKEGHHLGRRPRNFERQVQHRMHELRGKRREKKGCANGAEKLLLSKGVKGGTERREIPAKIKVVNHDCIGAEGEAQTLGGRRCKTSDKGKPNPSVSRGVRKFRSALCRARGGGKYRKGGRKEVKRKAP